MGEKNKASLLLGALLLLSLAANIYLYAVLGGTQEDLRGCRQADEELRAQLSSLKKVLISPEGRTSYPEARALSVPGAATYTYVLEEPRPTSIDTPEPLDGQSAFGLCYELEQPGQGNNLSEKQVIIRLKNAYTEEFYGHCEGDYVFPVLADGKAFSAFTLLLMPGPER